MAWEGSFNTHLGPRTKSALRYTLLIPSKGRPSLREATADSLVVAGYRPVFVVPDSEVTSYEIGNPDCYVIPHPDSLLGLPEAMRFALGIAEHVAIVFDDDLRFYNRFDGTSRLPRNKPEETRRMVEWLVDAALRYGHATVSPTQYNNHQPEDWATVVAARSVLAYDTRLLRDLDIKLARVPSKSDYDITLQLLRKGYPNICAYNMCHNQMGGPTLPGGCTPYRDESLHRRASEQLAALHPGFVRVVTKMKPEWAFPRVDVVVSWRKAYESGLNDTILR